MKPLWRRDGTAWFAWLVAVYCLTGSPLFGQCGEANAPPPAMVSTSQPSAIITGDGTELANYWAALGPDAALWYQHVQALSSPAFEGREPGTRGIERAADYIEFHFREYGLIAPFASEVAVASYRQPVSFEVAAGPDTAALGSLSFADERLVAGKDFVITSIAGEGVAAGPITFVGYGVEQGPEGYSSFDANSDLAGRIALLFRLEPLREGGEFRWGAEPSQHSSMIAKLSAVADRGAAGILIVNPSGAKHTLPELDTLASAGSCCSGTPRLPTAMITLEAANRLLRAADPKSRDLFAWRQLADEGKVRTVNLRDDFTVTLTARVKPRLVKTDNVAGALPGRGALKDQWLVIGGHYDHVGRGLGRADSGDEGVLLGADDNASGTAVVLQLAERLGNAYADAPPDANLRSIMFVAFTAEEYGLIGSRHFLQHAPMSPKAIDAMLNFDAVGRLRDNKLWLYGYATAKEFGELIGPLLAESGLAVITEPGSHSSDQVVFQEIAIPVLFANTGGHGEYHTSRDVASTVNPRGAAKILELSEKIARHLAQLPGKLTYQKQATTGGSCCPSSQTAAGEKPCSAKGGCGSSNTCAGGGKSKCCG